MDSVFDCNFEIYDDLVQRRSNLIRQRNSTSVFRIGRRKELKLLIDDLTENINAMRGGVE